MQDEAINVEVLAPPPWYGIEIPDSWRLCSAGLYKNEGDRDESPSNRISGPVWVEGRISSQYSDNWGHVVAFLDHNGKAQSLVFADERLYEQGFGLIQELASRGLDVVLGCERLLLKYLGAFNPTRRVLGVSCTGWWDNTENTLAFVLPDETIAQRHSQKLDFRSDGNLQTVLPMHVKGSLEDWQAEVAARCVGHPMLVFGLCAALSPPLLKYAGLDGGGIHFYGRSSRGKTTLLQVAASVWGCGSDPALVGALSYIQRWNTTFNGAEGLAAAHCDLLLAMDEIGTRVSPDFSALLYMMAGGQGRTRMTGSGKLRHTSSWRLLMMSSGEISVRQKLDQDAPRRAKAGQLLRMLDIPAEQVITAVGDEDPAQIVDGIKKACGLCYGTAGRAFIKKIIDQAEDEVELKDVLESALRVELDELVVPGLTEEVTRAMKRLAQIQVAGVMACQMGILPFTIEEVKSAVRHVRDVWLPTSQSIPDVNRAVSDLVSYYLKHPDQFPPRLAEDTGFPPRDVAGYRDNFTGGPDNVNCIYFTKEGMRRAIGPIEPGVVAAELDRLGYLKIGGDGRLDSKEFVKYLNKNIRLYVIRMSILERDDHDIA